MRFRTLPLDGTRRVAVEGRSMERLDSLADLGTAALDPVWRKLSRSGRQVKLTVVRAPDGFRLQVPGEDAIRLDAYLGATGALGEGPASPS